MRDIRILFLTHPYPNYVPDLLLHGLRKLLGPQVIDYPKKDCVYKGVLGLGVCPDDQLCPNWFPPDNNQIDREDIPLKVSKGYFSYIICDIRASSMLQDIFNQWPRGIVLIDGEDHPVKIPAGPYVICRRETDGTDFSIPLPMALPEEIYHWILSLDNLEKIYTIGFLGSIGEFNESRKIIVETLSAYYPHSLLHTSLIPSEGNQQPIGRFGRNDYYTNLQRCKMVLSLPGAGYDTFRFWENAACNAVHISQKMRLFVPHDFENGQHVLRFCHVEELRRQIDNVLEEKIDVNRIINESRNQLIGFHLTTKRAEYLLDRLISLF